MADNYEMKYTGVVKSISEDYEDSKMRRLDIEPSNYPKPKKKKGEPTPFVERRSETVSADMAKGLSVGDRVEVVTMISKALKRRQPQVR